jgi:hypothetical protein
VGVVDADGRAVLALGVYPRLLFGVQNDAVVNLMAYLGG